MGFSRQAYWIGLPFLSLGDLPGSGIEPADPVLAGKFLTTEAPGKSLPNRGWSAKANTKTILGQERAEVAEPVDPRQGT